MNQFTRFPVTQNCSVARFSASRWVGSSEGQNEFYGLL
jgi:hypothetical protein